MSGLLALDLATWLGWAFCKPGWAAPVWGTNRLPKIIEGDVAEYILNYRRWLYAMIDQRKPGTILFEAPWIGQDSNTKTARALYGLTNETEVCAKLEGIDCYEVNNARFRQHFHGQHQVRYPKGSTAAEKTILSKAFKARTVDEAALRGWAVDNDNEGDAVALLDWGVNELEWSVGWNCGPWKVRQSEAARADGGSGVEYLERQKRRAAA